MKKILKKTAHAYFWAPYFFLSLLAGKFATIEQMLLTELVKKSIRQKIVQQLIKTKTKVQLNHEVTFAYAKLQISSIF